MIMGQSCVKQLSCSICFSGEFHHMCIPIAFPEASFWGFLFRRFYLFLVRSSTQAGLNISTLDDCFRAGSTRTRSRAVMTSNHLSVAPPRLQWVLELGQTSSSRVSAGEVLGRLDKSMKARWTKHKQQSLRTVTRQLKAGGKCYPATDAISSPSSYFSWTSCLP